MRSRTLLLGSFIALLAVPAMAQGNNAINVIGTVDKMDATTISVKNDEGQMQTSSWPRMYCTSSSRRRS